MSLRGPEEKSLLRQIGCVRFLAAEREREAIKRHVKFLDEFFEVEIRHTASVIDAAGAAKKIEQAQRFLLRHVRDAAGLVIPVLQLTFFVSPSPTRWKSSFRRRSGTGALRPTT